MSDLLSALLSWLRELVAWLGDMWRLDPWWER